ncbi:hypothetical protein Y1Q_0007386 [Alligator mississippiensis]|uniref:Uncharacterized protein n=1 Tax=Alligator mississippiensis TaxID=8496 RepID=A0A151P7Y5_ALLMI|nr:hypothetical protein Y1Q_0007386 [Alligator mississippiensis]
MNNSRRHICDWVYDAKGNGTDVTKAAEFHVASVESRLGEDSWMRSVCACTSYVFPLGLRYTGLDITWNQKLHLFSSGLASLTLACQLWLLWFVDLQRPRGGVSQSSTYRILGIQRQSVQKLVLRRLLAFQEIGKEIPPAMEERQGEIRRVRRSWLSEYMNDLWSHVRETFPRSALYAFPIALGLMLVLCSITVLME